MEEEEFDLLLDCRACGRRIDVDAEVTYSFGECAVLCFDCAIDRGGRYDVDEDHWLTEPLISDVALSTEACP